MLVNSIPEEHRRKRVRKGTKSCLECKRRKIKCIPSPEPSICTGCLERKTTCLSQEYVDDNPSHHAEDSALARRMARIESLLETLMDRIPGGGSSNLTPSSILETLNVSGPSFPSLSHDSRGQIEVGPPTGKLEVLRQRLARMLPLQEDVDCLLSSSHGWWLIQQHMMTHLPESTKNDSHGLFNVSAVSQGHPITIARLLLCVAICIQQLPPVMDTREFQTKIPPRETMSTIIEFLVQSVTSDDEITASVEGVECLALMGIYEVNAGNLRRSWLAYRKAVTIAQLLGLHRVGVKTPESRELQETRQHHLWCQVSRGERYLSTLLVVPSATGIAVLPFDDDAVGLSQEDVYHKHLYHIAGLILARNQEDSTHSFSTTQRIWEQLDALAETMSSTWWEVPTNILNDRTKEASTQFERVMCQIWHFQLATLLHLPFMLRAANDRRYEYSRLSCLNASRRLIQRWLAIRENNSTFYFSNLLEFEAFTAATTLILGLIGPQTSTHPGVLQERREDRQLVETVVKNFERLKQQGSGMSVGDQSISVIRTIQGFLDQGNLSGNLCLDIPFFGTIRIARGGAVQPLEGERILGANAPQKNPFPQPTQLAMPSSAMGTDYLSHLMSRPKEHALQDMVQNKESYSEDDVGRTNTILQFSGGHLQLLDTSDIQCDLEANDWPYQESDMIFFESLVNTDLVGNWTL